MLLISILFILWLLFAKWSTTLGFPVFGTSALYLEMRHISTDIQWNNIFFQKLYSREEERTTIL